MTNTETAGAGTHSDRPMQHDEALRRAGMVAIRIGREGDIQAAETVRAQIARIQALEADNQTLRTGYAAARLEIESLRGRVGVVPAPRSVTEPTQVELDAFILRAGFRPGWENLESWARRMAEQAVREINEARAMRAAQPATADDRAAFKAYLEDCDECAIVPDIAGAFHAGWTSRVRAAQPAGAQQPGAAYAALPDECDSPEICAISKTCAGQFGTKRICASHGQAPAQAAPAVREAVAKAIYDQWVYKDGWVAWVNGGNSLRQDDARRLADLAFAMAQEAPAAVAGPSDAVAYLDIGTGGYLDLGTDLNDEALSRLPKGRHALVIAGTYGIDGYAAAPTTQPAPQQEAQEPGAGARCKIIPNCKSCQHSVGRLSCALAGKKFDGLARAPVPPEWCPLPLYTPQPSPASQGDALPREELAWMVVQEACETEPADEDDPECIRILRRDLKSSVLAAFLRHDAARATQKGKSHG